MLELFITGTEQNPGKNFITAGLAATMQSLGYSSGVYKPVATGAKVINGILQSPETAFVKFVDPHVRTYNTYLFSGDEDPIVAGVAEGKIINPVEIIQDYQDLVNINEITIIEGNNGLATPLGRNFLEEDLIKSINVPILFAVAPKKTPINNVILSVNHANSQGILIRGIIINDYPENTTDKNIKYMPRMIEEYTDTKILGILGKMTYEIHPDELISNILTSIDIEGVLQMKIAKLEI